MEAEFQVNLGSIVRLHLKSHKLRNKDNTKNIFSKYKDKQKNIKPGTFPKENNRNQGRRMK
jgi:hypothetical protein